MASGFKHTFSWNGPAQSVILTGTFDNWSSSVTLEKTGENKFERTISFPYGQKVEYKFVVDGEWKTKEDDPTEMDGGNLNNVLNVPAKSENVESAPTADAQQADSPVKQAESSINKVLAGFAGAAGAAIQTVVGVDPINGTPKESPEATREVPPEPVHTPAVPSTATTDDAAAKSQPTVPSDEKIAQAADDATTSATAPKAEEKSDAPLIAAGAAAVGAVGAGAAVAAQKAAGAGKEAAETAAAKAGVTSNNNTTSTSGAAVGNEGPTSEFGKSTMQALGLDGNKAAGGAATGSSTKGVEGIKPAEPTPSAPVVLNDAKLNTTAPTTATKKQETVATSNGSAPIQTTTNGASSTVTPVNAPAAPASTPAPAAAPKQAPATPAKDVRSSPLIAQSQSTFQQHNQPAQATTTSAKPKYLEGKGQPGAPSSTPLSGSTSSSAGPTPTAADGSKAQKQRKPSFFQKLKKALK